MYVSGKLPGKPLKEETSSPPSTSVQIPGYEHLGKTMPYNEAKKLTAGYQGEIQAHHLLEQRIAEKFDINTNNLMSTIVTRAQHQDFTKAWRSTFSYGTDYSAISWERYVNAGKSIYANYPDMLNAFLNDMNTYKSYFPF